MEKKRILILPSWYPDAANPLNGLFVHEQAVVLSKKYDVAVLTVQPVGWRQTLRGQAGLVSQARVMDGIPIYKERGWIPVPRTPWFVYHAFVEAVRRGLKRLIQVWGPPDLLHAHVVLPMGYAAMKAGLEYNIPVILTEHTSPFSFHLQTGLQRRIVADTLRNVNTVVAVSPSLSKTIQSFVSDIVPSVLGNLALTDYFTPAPSSSLPLASKPVRFLTVGFLVEQKGIGVLLDAVSLLIRQGITEFEVIIGGDGILRLELEKQAKELHLNVHCRFIGSLTRTQVRDEIRQSDVFVLPSLHETFGVVLIEAMACGKPVISTQCGGPEYVVTPETGLLVEPDDPSALAEAMKHFILGNVQYSAETIRKSVASRFGEDAFLANISSIYEHIMPMDKLNR